MVESDTPPPSLLIGDDVLGGFFALDGGRFSPSGRNIWYFSPDTLEWEDTEKGYSDFLYWCFVGDLAGYYETYRWPGWEQEVESLRGDQGFSIAPFLFTRGPEIAARSRAKVPISELFNLHVGTA